MTLRYLSSCRAAFQGGFHKIYIVVSSPAAARTGRVEVCACRYCSRNKSVEQALIWQDRVQRQRSADSADKAVAAHGGKLQRHQWNGAAMATPMR